MQRVAFVLQVRANRIEEYKQRHEQVWPEMLAALRTAGWHNYSLFLRDDGLLFGYFETPVDMDTALRAMAGTEVNARWQSQMAPFFESPDNAAADQMMIRLTEVFHLD